MLRQMSEYLVSNADQLAMQVAQHLWVSLLSLAIAVVVGVPLGYLASRSARAERIATVPFQALRVVPSLALLVLLVPVVGVGTLPAVIALTALAVPPVLLNTMVGFRQVPGFMVESARGMGMDDRQVLWRVRVPLAMPLILSGVRTALVEVVASATLAARIGAGGLGEVIFTGLGLNRADILVVGGVLVAALSLGLGAVFDAIARRVLRWRSV